MYTVTTRARVAALALPLLVFSAAGAGCDIALADYKQKETAEWRKTYEVQPGGRVEIINVNGKIDVEPSSGNRVEVVAEKTARGATSEAARQALDRIEILETSSASGVRIETKAQRSGGGLMGHSNQQVQYRVKVPAAAEVTFRTVNGGIELSGLTGRISAETTNGGIKAHEVSGYIDASTTNGGVDVDLVRLAEAGVKLGCTNGGITLRLPADSRATISARVTNGGIDTNGLQIDTTGESSRRRLDGKLNGGGAPIDIEGTNGGIHIAGR
jgi:putative adhesin